MKSNISLSIPKTCSESWNTFTPASAGRFCASCSKIVVDFTKMSDEDIIQFFATPATHTCGRFRADQLKVYLPISPLKINPGFTLLKVGLLSLLLTFVSKPTSARQILGKVNTETTHYPVREVVENVTMGRDQVVRGVVKSKTDDGPLPGVNVYLKGSEETTITDVDGRFEFPRKLQEGDVLIFSFIGLQTQEYVVPKKVNELVEIRMDDDFMLLGEVAVNEVYTTPTTGFQKLWSRVKGLF
jgi:hypothetical protein